MTALEKAKELDPNNQTIISYMDYVSRMADASGNQLLQEAKAALAQGDCITARIRAEEALNSRPDLSDARDVYARADSCVQRMLTDYLDEAEKEFQNGNYSKSVELYGQVLVINSNNDRARDAMELSRDCQTWYDEAQNAFSERKYWITISYCQRILKQNKRDKNAQQLMDRSITLARSIMEEMKGEFNDAYSGKNWSRVVEIGNALLEIDNSLYDIQRKVDEANREIDKIVEQKYQQAIDAMNSRNYSKAISLFDEILAYRDPYKDARERRNEARVSLRQAQAAASSRNAERIEQLLNAGISDYRAGRLCEAISKWKQGLNLGPDSSTREKLERYISRARYKAESEGINCR